MAKIQSSTMFCKKGLTMAHSSSRTRSSAITCLISLPKLPSRSFPNHHENLMIMTPGTSNTTNFPKISINGHDHDDDIIAKMYVIMEAVADRVEMHRNVGEQRDNWNALLLASVNSMTLAAATMTGIASAASTPAAALTLGATVLYLSAAALLSVMNKIQPSQLAEEQRNAARLFQQLRNEIMTKISLRSATASDVADATERVLALDKAYPLPLLGAMIEKFPNKTEPAVWWPKRSSKPVGKHGEEMRAIGRVIENKDLEEYLRLGDKALKLNKILAMSGPVLTGLAAVGAALSGHGALPGVVGVVGGVLASVVNALEHGGQVGMVFEMYRSNAGFFELVRETVESNVNEKRESNDELLEMKIALQLGRSVSELKSLAHKSRSRDHSEEFASKLF